MAKNKTSKLVTLAAGIISALTPLTANPADTLYSGNFIGNHYNHAQIYNAPRHYTPEQTVVVEKKEGKLFPWVHETWTKRQKVLTYREFPAELQGPCGQVYAPVYIPDYEDRCVTKHSFDYEWGRNIKNLCEKLKPKVSHYYGNVGADTCRPPISQPSTCTPAAPAPITCVPAEPQPSTCRPHEHYPSTCRPSPLEKAIGNLFSPFKSRPHHQPAFAPNPGYQTSPGMINRPTNEVGPHLF